MARIFGKLSDINNGDFVVEMQNLFRKAKKDNEQARLMETKDKAKSIDLLILTHHDDDHIGGILRYIKAHKNDNPFPVKKMWANCARVKDFQESLYLSPNQASKLADALTVISTNTGWEWKERIHEGYDCSDIDFADIEIIGPNEDLLNNYLEFYQKDSFNQKIVIKRIA